MHAYPRVCAQVYSYARICTLTPVKYIVYAYKNTTTNMEIHIQSIF